MAKFLTLFALLLAARYYAPAERPNKPVPSSARLAVSADAGGGDFSCEKPENPGRK